MKDENFVVDEENFITIIFETFGFRLFCYVKVSFSFLIMIKSVARRRDFDKHLSTFIEFS
jgi:hypothetical protein